MDDKRSFEDRLADELEGMAGPAPLVDALAVARSVAAQAPKRRFHIMFSATKLLLAGAIVALFGGFLMTSVLPAQQDAPSLPGAEASDTPSALITGVVRTDALERPVVDVRLTVSLVDGNADAQSAPLGQWVLEGANRVGGQQGIYPFTIDYAPDAIDADGVYVLETHLVESDTDRLMATGGVPIPVITDADDRTDGIDIQLVPAADADASPRLTGVLVPDPDLPDPATPARLVMTIRDASSQEPGAAPLAEFTRDGVTRLRPPSRFSFDYSADVIDDAGDYVLEARLEDAASGELLAASDGVIAVITKDNPVSDITVTLVAPDGATG